MARKKHYDLELPIVLDYERRPPSFWERLRDTTFEDFWNWCGGWPSVLIVLGALMAVAGMALTLSHHYFGRSLVNMSGIVTVIGIELRAQYKPY